MRLPLILSALALAMQLFPSPLLAVDALFHSLLVKSIMRVSDGAVGSSTASQRIRRSERIDPENSARIFAAIAFGVTCVWAAIASGDGVFPIAAAVVASGTMLYGTSRPPVRLAGVAIGVLAIWLAS